MSQDNNAEWKKRFEKHERLENIFHKVFSFIVAPLLAFIVLVAIWGGLSMLITGRFHPPQLIEDTLPFALSILFWMFVFYLIVGVIIERRNPLNEDTPIQQKNNTKKEGLRDIPRKVSLFFTRLWVADKGDLFIFLLFVFILLGGIYYFLSFLLFPFTNEIPWTPWQ